MIMIPTLILISLLCFIIIELPPGDMIDMAHNAMGRFRSDEDLANLRAIWGLDRPGYVRYFRWISRFVIGDFGYSFRFQAPVKTLIWNRFVMTAVISMLSLLFTWVVAFPIAIYSATHQYSFGDFFWTVIGFLGLAIPNFLLALILLVLFFRFFPNVGIGGLFAPRFQSAPWSIAKILNLMAHLVIPVIVVGTSSTCGLIRTVRANLLDEVKKPYVQTARAKGVGETKLLLKYPVRIALNPFFSTVGWVLPSLISGAVITAIVLGLPTSGPLLLRALEAQDMPLAGAFIMLMAILTVVGTLVSDILLAIVDPRIRFE